MRPIYRANCAQFNPVKITIGDITYDTNTAKKWARKPTYSSDQQLYQTPSGEFFLVILQLHADGIKLGPNEIWIDLGRKKPSKSRLCLTARILPLKNRKAMEWCIKTQIPPPFRGYILESI
jgi:hypothetical protein